MRKFLTFLFIATYFFATSQEIIDYENVTGSGNANGGTYYYEAKVSCKSYLPGMGDIAYKLSVTNFKITSFDYKNKNYNSRTNEVGESFPISIPNIQTDVTLSLTYIDGHNPNRRITFDNYVMRGVQQGYGDYGYLNDNDTKKIKDYFSINKKEDFSRLLIKLSDVRLNNSYFESLSKLTNLIKEKSFKKELVEKKKSVTKKNLASDKKKNISSKDKEAEKTKSIPDIDKTIDIRVSAQARYSDYKMEAIKLQKSGNKNSERYKRLKELIRSEEQLLNVPRHKTFDNPGYVNERTGNKYIDDANRRINNVKQATDQIADVVSGTITSIIEANAYNKGMKERAKSLEYQKKQRKKRLELEIKRQEEKDVEKDLLESWLSKQLAANTYFLKISLDQQRTLEKLAPKFIDKIECPNLRCKSGKIKIVTTSKKICTSCKGKKTLHNFGKGGGCWNGCKNYMSCLSCDGTGYQIVDKTSEEKCPLCKGDGHLLEYKGKGIIPHRELKNIYAENSKRVNQFSQIRNTFEKYKDLQFLWYNDFGNSEKIGFVDRDLKTIIKPMFTSVNLIDVDKSIVKINKEFGVGVVNKRGEVLIPMEYENIVSKNDSLYLFKDEFIYKADKEGKEIISQKTYNIIEYKNKNKEIEYAIRLRNNKREFVDRENNVISDSISDITYNHFTLGQAYLLKIFNEENKPHIFDPVTRTLSITSFDNVKNTKDKNGIMLLEKNGKKGF